MRLVREVPLEGKGRGGVVLCCFFVIFVDLSVC